MSLLALSLPLFLLGIPVLAFLLFSLHRLRIRHQRMEVVTTLFWQEAIEEARARVLVQRFRHPLVYAFLLLISLLLWSGFSDPRLASDPKAQSLILVEGARVHQGSTPEDALAAVQDLLSEMPSEGRSVIWCGARERTLLASGEHAALLEARWQKLEPQATPSHLAAIVGRLARQQRETPLATRLPLHLILVGTETLPKDLLSRLPRDMSVQRLEVEPRSTRAAIELVALGMAPASSGAWNRVDLLLRLRAALANPKSPPRLELAGSPVTASPSHRVEDGVDRYLFTDLPAEGQLLQVFAGGSKMALGSILLPKRRVLQVQVEEGLPPELLAVLEADPGLRLVDSRPDVRIGTSTVTDGVPHLWLDPKSREPVFRFTQTEGSRGETSLRRRFGSLGLDGIDAEDPDVDGAGAAKSGSQGVQVRVDIRDGSRRSIQMPLALLGHGYNFVQSRVFPLFFAQALRWLTAVEEAPRRVAAGEILRGDPSARTDAQGVRLDPVGASFYLPRAGLYQRADGAVLAASLLSPMDDSERAVLPPLQLDSAGSSSMLFWITLLALLALVAEWILVRTGRMP